MASREEYTSCMVPFMKGKGKTKEERQIDMCIGAKICSGKAATEAEAEQICINQPPKEPKERKKRGSIDLSKIVSCLATSLEIEGLTPDNVSARLETAVAHCKTGTKSPSYKKFMNACVNESAGGKAFLKAQGNIKACQEEWNKTRGV